MRVVVLAVSLLGILACGTKHESQSGLDASTTKVYFKEDGTQCNWPYLGCWRQVTEVLEQQYRYEGFPVWSSLGGKVAGAEFQYETKKDLLNAPLQNLNEVRNLSYRLFTQDSLTAPRKYWQTNFKKGLLDKIYWNESAQYLMATEILPGGPGREEGRLVQIVKPDGTLLEIFRKEAIAPLSQFEAYPSPLGKLLVIIDCLGNDSLLSQGIDKIPLDCRLDFYKPTGELDHSAKLAIEEQASMIELAPNKGLVLKQMWTWLDEETLEISNHKSQHLTYSIKTKSFTNKASVSCEGPASNSSRNSFKKERLGISNNQISIIKNLSSGTESYLCR